MADSSANALPQTVLRNLGEKSYEKRKSAALEIELQVKEHYGRVQNNEPSPKIKAIINVLVTNYTKSTQPNQRKGGLIGLAATAIALREGTQGYLQFLLPPVLKCLQDKDARVRYYACEALYNITKVARGSALIFFNEIFDGLCRLFEDNDPDVKNGAQLLDRLLKDVVTENESFDVPKFIPLLQERVSIREPYIRQLLVGWITVLDSVPDIDMLKYLPQYLSGLFDMLSDVQRDIRQQAFAALAEFLREIVQNGDVDLGPMIPILIGHSRSSDDFTRLTSLAWLHEFVTLGKTKLLPFCADMLDTLLQCISDKEEEIRQKAENANATLLDLVEGTDEAFDFEAVVTKLNAHVLSKWVPTRLAALRWISMLLDKSSSTMLKFLDTMYPPLFQTLSHSDEHVVRLDLEVLARIAMDDVHFEQVLVKIMQLFSRDRKLLESRGSIIIRQLCLLLDGEHIYREFGKILLKEKDLPFASLMVQTLNLILLTSAELFELRSILKDSLNSEEGLDLFLTLYKSWAHSPVSTFSLCLLSQCYELASHLAARMCSLEITVGFLMQIDKLVQLIESPIFVELRLQLLEPQRYPFLLKSLYGLLMILPQSSAFISLKTRLESVSALAIMHNIPQSKFSSSTKKTKAVDESKRLDFNELLNVFNETQELHTKHRQEVIHSHSLLKRSSKK